MQVPYPLVEVYRSARVESIHYGHAVVYGANGVLAEYGSGDFACYTRSIIKPIQAKVSRYFLNANLNDKFLAIACASHQSSEEQISTLKDFAESLSLSSHHLRCGCNSKFPHDPIYNNCAGKHFAMIGASKLQGFDIENYLSPEHPLQQAVAIEMKRLLQDTGVASIPVGIDGCGLPTFYLSLTDMAKIFHSLIIDPEYKQVIAAMNQYPQLVGGKSQADTLIMQSYPGKFIAKGGAEGLLMIANLELEQALVIKIVDGSGRAKAAIAAKFMNKLGWGSLVIDNSIINAHGWHVGEYC